MFHIDTTFEDQRIIAMSHDGHSYDVTITDSLSGDFRNVLLTALQLSYIMAFNLHSDGEPEGYEKMYEELTPIFVGWPQTVRPIP